MKLSELFNKKKLNWTAEKEYIVNRDKSDVHPLSKIFVFLPLALVFSAVMILVTVAGLPKTMDGLKSVLLVFGQEQELKPAAQEVLFVDVKADSKYFDSLAYLKKMGIISGFDDNSFRPYQELKRGELVKTLVGAKKLFPLALNYNSCFKDVSNQWFAPSICLAKEKGWINGYTDGSFHPDETLTKSEALKIIMSAFEIAPDSSNPVLNMFEDLDKDAWYYPYVNAALNKKLIDDNPNLEFYEPESPALRGDVAQIIYRVILQG